MNKLELFSSLRIDDDKFCCIYVSEDRSFYIPIIIDGYFGDMAEHFVTGDNVAEDDKFFTPIVTLRSTIDDLGAVILYGELKYDPSFGGIIGRIVSRQQNEVNSIFSMVAMPVSYVIAMGMALLVDDETAEVAGFTSPEDVNKAIGINIEEGM